jgi:hypothetical protein
MLERVPGSADGTISAASFRRIGTRALGISVSWRVADGGIRPRTTDGSGSGSIGRDSHTPGRLHVVLNRSCVDAVDLLRFVGRQMSND